MTQLVGNFMAGLDSPLLGASATIRIRRIDTGALVVTDAPAPEIGDGAYGYNFTTMINGLDYAWRMDSVTGHVVGGRYFFGAVSGDHSRSIHGSGGFAGTMLSAVFLARKDGAVLTTPTDASVIVKDMSGATLATVASVGVPNSDGVFTFTVAAALLIDEGAYLDILVTDAGGDIAGIIPIARQS